MSAKLFQGAKAYKISVSDTATRQQVISTPITDYKAYVLAGGSDVIIKWGDSSVTALNTLTGNVYDDEGIDIVAGGTVQTLRKPANAEYVSVICESGGTATIDIILGDGE